MSELQRVKSIADSFPERISMWVGDPSLSIHKFVFVRKSSIVFPFRQMGSEFDPQMGLWALKSPRMRNGFGSCFSRLWSSLISRFNSGR